jgi:hypothetical protein
LLLCQIAALLMARPRWLAPICAAALALVPELPPGGIATVAARDLIYFIGGVGLAPWLLRLSGNGYTPLVAGASALGLVALLLVAPTPAIVLARAACGIAMVVAVSRLIGDRLAWLKVLGRASMAIYVLHTFFSAGCRMAFRDVWAVMPFSGLVIATLVGLAAPVGVYVFAQRRGWSLALGLGRGVALWSPGRSRGAGGACA